MQTLRSVRRGLGRWLIVLSLIGGCDDWRKVRSPTRPDSVTYDGIDWVALKRNGENDLWFYVPHAVAAAALPEERKPGEPFDVLVKRKLWRLTPNDNGVITFSDPIDPPFLPPNPITVFVWIVLNRRAPM